LFARKKSLTLLHLQVCYYTTKQMLSKRLRTKDEDIGYPSECVYTLLQDIAKNLVEMQVLHIIIVYDDVLIAELVGLIGADGRLV
jgi:hypothetical protein